MDRTAVGIIVGQLGLGGAEKQLYLLLRELTRTGVRATVLNLNPGRNDHWEQPIRDLGVQVTGIPRVNRLYRAVRIASELKRARATVVHSWVFHANGYAALSGRLAGVPVRLGSVREHPSGWPESHLLRRVSMTGLSGVVVNSAAAASELKNLFPTFRGFISTIPNAIEPTSSVDRRLLRDWVAKKYDLDRDLPWVAGVGRLDANKNWDLLIHACHQLQARSLRFQLVLFGDGPDRSRLAAASASLRDEFRLAGAVSNAKSLLSAFDALALVSRTEGMPNVLLEAAAEGVPAVATAVGGSIEVVDHGRTGFLAQPDNVHDVADHLHWLIERPREARAMGQRAQEWVLSKFSVERMAASFVSLYGEHNPRGQRYAA